MNTKHLKAKILDLAIRGKLVPQDPSEGNAADLLKKIRKEKGGESLPLATAGKPSFATPSAGSNAARNARSKNTSFIIKADDGKHYEQFSDGCLKDIEDEIPFEIPENWCWCRLQSIFDFIGGGTPDKSKSEYWNGKIPWASVKDIKGLYLNRTIDTITEQGLKAGSSLCTKNELILVTRINPGKVIISNIETAINQDLKIARLKNQMCREYLRYCFNFFEDRMYHDASGSTVKGVKIDYLNTFLFPLPPLPEQKRIVSAIEKAFEQIDIIEKNKDNLKNYIKQTKNKVLDLAIHGKLVEQNPQEGNAADLLQKIREEKDSSNSELDSGAKKKSKTDKNTSFIIKADDGKHYEQFADGSLKDIEEEIPFEEPSGWTWCRINEIAKDMADGPFGSNLKTEHYTTNKEARIIQLSNLSDEGWREENTRYTTIKHATENISRSIVEAGNIVIAKMMPAGRAMICPDKEQMYVLSSDCVKLVPVECVYKQFLVRALNSPFFRNRVVDNVQGVTRQRTSISKLRSCYFPLPPFEEQKRIVMKLEQVFQQLDILEKSLGE
ncbi:MAG: restriction endonuclease subunit S [Treponema sp.]|nr:restriction endonuclease subunit S [Treponema sp.]